MTRPLTAPACVLLAMLVGSGCSAATRMVRQRGGAT